MQQVPFWLVLWTAAGGWPEGNVGFVTNASSTATSRQRGALDESPRAPQVDVRVLMSRVRVGSI